MWAAVPRGDGTKKRPGMGMDADGTTTPHIWLAFSGVEDTEEEAALRGRGLGQHPPPHALCLCGRGGVQLHIQLRSLRGGDLPASQGQVYGPP